jgi:hypothetical protein
MRLIFILFMALTLSTGTIVSQEAGHFSLGAGIEANLNVREGLSLSENLSFDYGITKTIAAGIKFGYSYNFDEIVVLEPEAFVRWYFWELEGIPLFTQVSLGSSIIFEDGEAHPVVLGGLSAGLRIPLNRWYVESSLRGGYPFIWGIGVSAGYRF